MQAHEGETILFGDYIKRAARQRARPVIWRADALAGRLASAELSERGTVALIDGASAEAVTAAPGLSCTIQVVPPGGKTRRHAHSFWHLCLVRSGSGHASFGDDGAEDPLTDGDILFIPAWCSHAFTNRRADAPLMMVVIQNLPSVADAGTLARQESDQEMRVVYAE